MRGLEPKAQTDGCAFPWSRLGRTVWRVGFLLLPTLSVSADAEAGDNENHWKFSKKFIIHTSVSFVFSARPPLQRSMMNNAFSFVGEKKHSLRRLWKKMFIYV